MSPAARRWWLLVSALVLLAALVLALEGPSGVRQAWAAFQELRQRAELGAQAAVPWPWLGRTLGIWTRTLLAPHLYLPFVVILLLERRWPAIAGQRALSPAVLNDFIWYLAQMGVFFVVLLAVGQAMSALYLQHLGFLPRNLLGGLPGWARLVLVILLGDLLDWVQHFVRHKVPALWWFHTVHHAQTASNTWSNERVHLFEYVVAMAVRLVPASILGVSLVGLGGYQIFAAWHTRLAHSNVRTNLGPLRFLLVTPQSHRVHHSARPEHQDKNFGVVFSFWDRLFGTHWPEDDVYPETGIDDPRFPHERTWGETLALRPFLAQQLYPLRLVARRLRALIY